tara:strand:+ start:179 stop:673 length:495 start_codon:yes stop_codon:yes gene_type:complete
MDFFYFFSILSILSCSLVTGFIFTYAVVVMPGLSKLNDKEFLKAFQVTDEVIQNKQPIFMLTWVGSIVSVLSLILTSIIYVGLSETWLVVLIALIYLLGVQGITILIHLPLNNHIQKLNLEKFKDENLKKERLKFEKKWNFYNNIRSAISFFVSLGFLIILIQK